MGWTLDHPTAIRIATERPLNEANPHFARVELPGPGRPVHLMNDGFAGIGVKKGETYRFSVFARSTGAAVKIIHAELVDPAGQALGAAELEGFSGTWERHEVVLRSRGTEAHARLAVRLEGSGSLDLDMVSLFPVHTWKNRPNGLRADLVQMLADLRPGFVRFPGGCIVEGRTLENRYQWKTTVGAPEQRKLILNRWNNEFKHRPAPDYFQSFGLGFLEYFLLCEDIGAQPLPILNCGMACQFNSSELAPLDQLDPYVQDMLDLVEFANGATDTPWGARRAALGHPQPFGLRLLGIGNEQWGPQYVERYTVIAKALKARHPDLRLVSSAGPSPGDDRFEFLWKQLREHQADIVDEHCYDLPAWFLDNTRRYDDRPRTGPKVFFGEYAAQSVKVVSPENRNTWGCALAEAAFLTGLERNADVVEMASYAPLFAHEERWQWRPNLIWFDNLRVYGTPNYYVQQLFSRNRGDRILPVELGGIPQAANGQPRFYASATQDDAAGEVIVKLVNATEQPVDADVAVAGVRDIGRRMKVTQLAHGNLAAENSLLTPRNVAPETSNVRLPKSEAFRWPCAPNSVQVLRIPASPTTAR